MYTVDKIHARLGDLARRRRALRNGVIQRSLSQPPVEENQQLQQQQRERRGNTTADDDTAAAAGTAAAATTVEEAARGDGGDKRTGVTYPTLESCATPGAFLSLETPASSRRGTSAMEALPSVSSLSSSSSSSCSSSNPGPPPPAVHEEKDNGGGNNASSSSSSSSYDDGGGRRGSSNCSSDPLEGVTSNRLDLDGNPSAAAATAAASPPAPDSSRGISSWEGPSVAEVPAVVGDDGGGGRREDALSGGDEGEDRRSRGAVELSLFSFGAPRAGNTRYAARYNAAVPRSFRIVVDGDPVPVRGMSVQYLLLLLQLRTVIAGTPRCYSFLRNVVVWDRSTVFAF